MRGYLLDTMMLRYWFDEDAEQHRSVKSHIAALPEGTPLRLSAVTWGEIEYGHRVEARSIDPVQQRFTDFVRDRVPAILPITQTTAPYYGALRARLFGRYGPRERKKKARRPEELLDPLSSKELGIQENDLWISAQAVEHNLVLVSNDKMTRIRSALTGELAISVEDWSS